MKNNMKNNMENQILNNDCMEKKRILCFGDSLTWGFDPLRKKRFPERDRWPMVLQRELGSSFQVIEEGQPGRTIATDDPAEGEKNGLKYIIPCLESHVPLDIVVIMLGTNDCKSKFGYSAMDVAGEMQILLEKVLAYNHFRGEDRFKVLLVSPPVISEDLKESWLADCFGCEHAGKVSGQLAGWYRQLAEMYHCDYLDAASVVKVSTADGCHMDEENQQELGRQIAKYIAANMHQAAGSKQQIENSK